MDKNLEAKNPANNTFIVGFCIHPGTIDLEYYNMLFAGFWIYLFTLEDRKTSVQGSISMSMSMSVSERGRGSGKVCCSC